MGDPTTHCLPMRAPFRPGDITAYSEGRYACALHTGKGAHTATDRYWGSSAYMWNNDKDTVWLRNSPSGTLIDYCAYNNPNASWITADVGAPTPRGGNRLEGVGCDHGRGAGRDRFRDLGLSRYRGRIRQRAWKSPWWGRPADLYE